jgi:alkylation response protein AidB-like acyl-CoA dehydrogenase
VHFELSSELRSLRALIEQVLDHESSFEHVRAAATAGGYSEPVWKALQAIGIGGLLAQEDSDQDSAGPWEVCLVAEGLGRGLALVPFAWSSVFATSLAQSSNPSELRGTILASLAGEGEIAAPGLTRPQEFPSLAFEPEASHGNARELIVVPFGAQARWVLTVLDSRHDRVRLDIADTRHLKSALEGDQRSDLQAVSRVSVSKLDAASVGQLEVPMEGWLRANALTKLAIASYALGAQDVVIQMASEYALDRHQFGKSIGSFQGVAHRCADMCARATADRMLVWLAAWKLETGDTRDGLRAAGLAKARTTAGFAQAGTSTLQIFGGHGFASEGDVQLFYRHGRGLEASWGTPSAEYCAAAGSYKEVESGTIRKVDA